MRRLLGFVLSLALAIAPASAASALTLRDVAGIHVLSVQQLDSRLFAATVQTAALPAPANVRILLPSGYSPRTRYPVLYLLHGTSGRAFDWTTYGAAEQTTAGKPLIVVMPDIALGGDGGGWCTNWWNNGARGLPQWETFHIDQLIPWIDHNLPTLTARADRAIAGLSQGGFCSISYAARHPDLFGIALSYSGAPDIAYDAEAQTLVTPVINATETFLDHAPANSMFGPRPSEEINWAAHDPTTLAPNLRDTRLLLYTGNGAPGPFDQSLNPGASAIEWGVYQLTSLFHARLDALGIPSTYDYYGAGTHTWPYWTRDLQWSIDPLMADFGSPGPAVKRVNFTSADQAFAAYGWRVTMHRSVDEFATLSGAWQGGFTLSGSGSATVATPGFYRRGARYRVVIGGTRLALRAGRDHRLVISVPLGPSNTVQEYPLDGPPLGTSVYTTSVTVKHLRGRRR